MDATGKLALKAARLIEERGLCKGDYIDEKGRLCIVGAMNWSSDQMPSFIGPESSALIDRMHSMMGIGKKQTLSQWNDHPSTTDADVINMLVAAAYWEG